MTNGNGEEGEAPSANYTLWFYYVDLLLPGGAGAAGGGSCDSPCPPTCVMRFVEEWYKFTFIRVEFRDQLLLSTVKSSLILLLQVFIDK